MPSSKIESQSRDDADKDHEALCWRLDSEALSAEIDGDFEGAERLRLEMQSVAAEDSNLDESLSLACDFALMLMTVRRSGVVAELGDEQGRAKLWFEAAELASTFGRYEKGSMAEVVGGYLAAADPSAPVGQVIGQAAEIVSELQMGLSGGAGVFGFQVESLFSDYWLLPLAERALYIRMAVAEAMIEGRESLDDIATSLALVGGSLAKAPNKLPIIETRLVAAADKIAEAVHPLVGPRQRVLTTAAQIRALSFSSSPDATDRQTQLIERLIELLEENEDPEVLAAAITGFGGEMPDELGLQSQ